MILPNRQSNSNLSSISSPVVCLALFIADLCLTSERQNFCLDLFSEVQYENHDDKKKEFEEEKAVKKDAKKEDR
jgi:hypothetical protein